LVNFKNDYWMGAHPRVLNALVDCNDLPDRGYGDDSLSRVAAELIMDKLGTHDLDIHFVMSGTQANLVAFVAMLKPWEAVIAADTAHPNVHESGALEAAGHKIIRLETPDGKLTPAMIRKACEQHHGEHMVVPRVVFISNATELGTIYTLLELRQLREECNKQELYLYLDGARLGQALVAMGAGLTFTDLPAVCDAFYIGGTKNGTMFGEALVLVNGKVRPHFRNIMKQRGAMLAKGKFIAAQFIELLKDDLYLELAEQARSQAFGLATGIEQLGYKFAIVPESNQIFPIFPSLPPAIINGLQQTHDFPLWDAIDSGDSLRAVARLVTSWSTKPEDVQEFLQDLEVLAR